MINDEGLIKKSAVLKLLRNLKENRPYANLDTTLDVAAVNVRKMPTADVEEVVRCKDCESYNGHRWCNYFAEAVSDNDYCSYGKKVE